MADTKPSILTKQTLVPLGLIVTVLVFFAGLALSAHSWSVSDALWKQEVRLEIESLHKEIVGQERDYVSRSDLRQWVSEFRQGNPGVTIPDVPEHRE